MSNLSTLLEAARFLELQEQEQKQHMVTVEAALAISKPLATSPTPTPLTTPQTITLTQSKPITNSTAQTVVISSSNLLQTPITISTPTIKKEVVSPPPITTASNRHRVLHNSFDIINPLIIDENSGETKRKQPPLVFRSGTREVHNKLEKHRRAHLKECFDLLKRHLPIQVDEKKTSNLSILHSALRYIQTLKRKERDLEHEMERLAREKISAQQRLAVLKKEISGHCDNVDFSKLLPDIIPVTPIIPNSNVVVDGSSSVVSECKIEPISTNSNMSNGCLEKVTIPILAKAPIPVVSQAAVTPMKDVTQPVQATALSVLPMSYPMNSAAGLVLQKVALLPKGGSLTDLTPIVSTFIAPQQLNGKVVPLTQYLVKPVVVVSTASPRPS